MKNLQYSKKNKGLEVDFVIKEGLKASRLIQVCSDISDADTRAREINGHQAFGLLFCYPAGIRAFDACNGIGLWILEPFLKRSAKEHLSASQRGRALLVCMPPHRDRVR